LENAGARLWNIQKQQRTGLCVGLDPHYDPEGDWDMDLYRSFGSSRKGRAEDLRSAFEMLRATLRHFGTMWDGQTVEFLTGLTIYILTVIEAARDAGIQVFKPQAAFYEQFKEASPIILGLVSQHLRDQNVDIFAALDAKRGDIDTTQFPYYTVYPNDGETMPGVKGYGFDAMTVTTWMGEDVLSPGLPFFKVGKGAIVVTRTSNPSGTTLQDLLVSPSDVSLTEKQEPFRYTVARHQELISILGRMPRAYEVMLYLTTLFSRDNGLDVDGVSPIFSVMGATVPMDGGFRRIRGNGAIPLIPGFGAQKGPFKNVQSLIVREGPLTGMWGMLSSSRENMFAWLPKYGGKGDPMLLADEVRRSIDNFRKDERDAYAVAGVDYPF